jgi:hypothetical protein
MPSPPYRLARLAPLPHVSARTRRGRWVMSSPNQTATGCFAPLRISRQHSSSFSRTWQSSPRANSQGYNPTMRSRCRAGMVLVALSVHLLAPPAAYALTAFGPGFDDFCSANRLIAGLPGAVPTFPLPHAPKHASSHCAFCSGSASAAILPSTLSLPALVAVVTESLRIATRTSVASSVFLLPPSRGPPTSS